MLWRKRKFKFFFTGFVVLIIYIYILTSVILIDSIVTQTPASRVPKENKASQKPLDPLPFDDLLDEFSFQVTFEPKWFPLAEDNKLFVDLNKDSVDSQISNKAGSTSQTLDRVATNLMGMTTKRHDNLDNDVHQENVKSLDTNRYFLQHGDGLLGHGHADAAANNFTYRQEGQDIAQMDKNAILEHLNIQSQNLSDAAQANLLNKKFNGLKQSFSIEEKTLKEEIIEDDDCFEVSKYKTYGAITFPDFIKYGQPGDPGEHGHGFTFKINELSEADKRKRETDFKTHYFDEWVSRKIAVHRSLPDNRTLPCKQQKYNVRTAVSVLIVFYNEAWTTLLRSIHSILERTPGNLLKEIVLLDDFSDMDHLKEPLEVYLQPLVKVRLLRAKKRLGLIRARNLVFEHSSGEVVIFLDSHIECFPGWLKPLLAPIHTNNKTVTFPIIEYLNPGTFQVAMSKSITNVGGLNFDRLSFNWLYTRNSVVKNRADNAPSPTMPGGLYAISRGFFRQLGKYDPGMDIWGSENLEISFKVWMCGGSILLVPCSHVGHIFRKSNPALRGVSGLGFKNAVRVAEVWMDRYKHYFYEKIFYDIPQFGDVSSRVQLRNSLQCRDFGWYLEHVFPELKTVIDENSVYLGQIKNDVTNTCIDRRVESHLSLAPCRHRNIYQHWNLGTNGTLVSQDKLIGLQTHNAHLNATKPKLRIFPVGRHDIKVDSIWVYDDKQRLVHTNTGLCLQAYSVMKQALLNDCSLSPWQKWNFTTRKEIQAMYKNRGVSIDWTV